MPALTPSEHRLHPIALVFGLGGQLRELGFTLLAAFLAARGSGATLEIATAIAAIPVLGVAIARLLTYRFRFDRDELVIRHGIVFRRERRIPFARIQNLDSRETPLHRVTGTVAVRIETGTAGEAEAELVAIPRDVFDAMVLAVAAEPRASTATAPGTEQGEVLLTLNRSEVILAGLLHGHGGVMVAAILAIISQFGQSADLAIFRAITGPLTGDGTVGLALLGRVALTVLAFVIVLRVFSVLVALVRFHGHEVRILGAELHMVQGLFTRAHTTTPLNRIQTVTVRQGPWHRLAGMVRVQIATAGGGGTGAAATREIVAPVLAESAASGLIERLLPSALSVPAVWDHAMVRARGRTVRRVLVTGLAATALGWWVQPALGAMLLVGTLVWLLAALGRVRRFGYQARPDRLVLADGWIWRRTVHVPIGRMQSTGWSASPFDRRAGMAVFWVDTAGKDVAGVTLPHLAVGEAEILHARYFTAASGTAFAR